VCGAWREERAGSAGKGGREGGREGRRDARVAYEECVAHGGKGVLAPKVREGGKEGGRKNKPDHIVDAFSYAPSA